MQGPTSPILCAQNGNYVGYRPFCAQADFRVHIKRSSPAADSIADSIVGSSAGTVPADLKEGAGKYTKVPYFCLPGDVAERAIAKSCLACFDYTNGQVILPLAFFFAFPKIKSR